MKKLLNKRGIFPASFLLALLSLSVTIQAQSVRPRNTIPPAADTANAEERQWWESVRQAGTEAAKALERKESAIKERRRGVSNIPDNEEELLSKKEREKLNTALASAKEKYLGVLREGKDNGYRVPLVDGRPLILEKAFASFTNVARAAKVNGVIAVSLVFQADGTIGDPQVIRGLGFGLDEKAIEAALKVIFLPAVKAGTFSDTRSSMEFSFAIY
jgi:hypothetical protein